MKAQQSVWLHGFITINIEITGSWLAEACSNPLSLWRWAALCSSSEGQPWHHLTGKEGAETQRRQQAVAMSTGLIWARGDLRLPLLPQHP